MEYDAYTDLMIMAVFGLSLILCAMVMTRLERQKDEKEPPRWAEQANGPVKPRHVKRIRGYDPVLISPVGYDVKCVDLGRLK